MPTHELIFTGTSLGGFWANYFAQAYRQKCVLVNPSLNPSASLRKYVGENINFNTGEKKVLLLKDCDRYAMFELPLDKTIIRTTLLGTADETIPYEMTAATLQGTNIVFIRNGHRLENIPSLIKEIDAVAEKAFPTME